MEDLKERSFVTEGVSIPYGIKIYYKKELLANLISTDKPQIERAKLLNYMLQSMSEPVNEFNAWEVLKLGDRFRVEYVIYGNYGPVHFEDRSFDRIFNVNKEGPFMLIKIRSKDVMHPNEFVVDNAISLQTYLDAAFNEVSVENCGIIEGEPAIFLILPRTYIARTFVTS